MRLKSFIIRRRDGHNKLEPFGDERPVRWPIGFVLSAPPKMKLPHIDLTWCFALLDSSYYNSITELQ
jgi:hypothetical protein